MTDKQPYLTHDTSIVYSHGVVAGDEALRLGRYLYATRDLKQKSMAEVAEQAGVSPAYIQKLERGQVDAPSPTRLRSIARALGCEYMHLMRLIGYITETTMPDPAQPDAQPELNGDAKLVPDLAVGSPAAWRLAEQQRIVGIIETMPRFPQSKEGFFDAWIEAAREYMLAAIKGDDHA